jgi:hypothetical protein
MRKLGLTVHVIVSVGWVGAATAFLLLAISALAGDAATSRGAYLAMNVVGRGVLLPFSVGALTSGIVQSLGTRWGLLQHYWVIVKLVLTLFATAALFLHQFTAVAEAARLASHAAISLPGPSLRPLGSQLRADAGLAVLVLVAITAISIYKPWGLVAEVSRGLRLFLVAIATIVVAFVTLHLSGRSPHQHSH